MPSGAKRRKAAKKKKEKETLDLTNPQGDEGKSRDEKGSDGGQVGSKHQAKEWRPVAKDKSVDGDSSDAEAVRKDGVVRIERDSKEGSKSNKRAGSGKESSKASSSSGSSSSSSSDDESHDVDRRGKEKSDASVSEVKPATVAEEKPATVSEDIPASDLVTSVDSLLAEVTHSAGDASAEKTTSLDAEKTPSFGSDKPVASEPEMTVHLTETTQVDGLVISGTVVKPSLKNGSEKLLPTGDPESLTDSLPEKIETMVTPMPIENGKASLSVAESVSKENGSKVLPSLGVSPSQTSNDAGSIKESNLPEYSESQPLVAPSPRVVEKTSWFGCCGILDVITGSRT